MKLFVFTFAPVLLSSSLKSKCYFYLNVFMMIRNTVKLLSHGGGMLELCHELRSPFVSWMISNQVLYMLKLLELIFLLLNVFSSA